MALFLLAVNISNSHFFKYIFKRGIFLQKVFNDSLRTAADTPRDKFLTVSPRSKTRSPNFYRDLFSIKFPSDVTLEDLWA